MRITNNMINERTLFNIQQSLYRIARMHDKLSSGKEVQYPSDDAVIATRASNISSRLRELEQFKRNVDHVNNFVQSYDTTLQELSNVYHRIRELMVRGANGTNTVDERNSIAAELKALKEHLIEIANTRVGDEYIFGGARSELRPVDENGNIQTPIEANIRRRINALGYAITYGVTVYDVFTLENGKTVFSTIDDAISALYEGNERKLSEISLKEIGVLERSVMEHFASVGATSRMAEMVTSRIEDLKLFNTEYLSKEQDADLTKVLTQLNMQQAVLEASLKSAAMAIQKSLVDFVGG
ncbi:flagellar hook protein FlgL [Fervidobacterium sp. SC_NGM5_O18]|uniref:Flagellar hook protein FlgL n=1 Tax=Fervidobacterium pennivorans TaxID=93466 RepID=A0A172T497_FERPE|nr:flagellar hook-associated protein FlgL [Fervidobacterium pennivorans]ANE41762.1 flagellar hook protein FlgL [Fervidobacterium pennivorans]PHJ12862.1 flagellar hook protein FlgL [Fervidobacterium sp. SC_NGM5_O18]